jgi:tetratricopeptide (TPR) repeat protein
VAKRTKPSTRVSTPPARYRAPTSRSATRGFAGIALIVLATVVAYYPSLGGGFVLDDDKLLTDNTLIKASDGLYRFWFTTEPYDYWPVSNSTLWVEWRLWGIHPTGYHVTNLILHVATALLVWVILRRLAIPGAYLAALLFAVHPVNVETVAWIAQRKSLLALLFLLVSALCYLNAEARASSTSSRPAARRWYGSSLAAFVLAMLSKVSAAVLPPILLALVWWRRPLTRRDLMRVAPFFLIDAVLLSVNVWFRTHGAETPVETATAVERVLGAAGAVWFYLSKAVLPLNLTFIYPEWHVRADQWRWWLALAAAAAVSAVLWRYRQGWGRALLLAWGYFCLALVPVLGFTDVGYKQHVVVADHYQHAALIGVVALATAGWALWRARLRGPARWAAPAVAAAATAVLAVLTWRQSALYVDGTTLYRDTLAKNPAAFMAHTNLGAILSQAGQSEAAIGHFEEALRLKPDYPEARSNLGRELSRMGRLEEAIAYYRDAIEDRGSNFPEALTNLGEALARSGQLQEAMVHYRRALALKPDLAEAHSNLCNALLQARQPREAMEHCREAVRLKPQLPEAQYNLANALMESGQVHDAIHHYEECLRLKPDYAEAHNNLAAALARVGQPREAIGHLQQALRIKPDFPDARKNLGIVMTMTDQ